MGRGCRHTPPQDPAPAARACQECGRTTNLRVCATCGHVGCCESSPGQHARGHALSHGHPVIHAMPVGPGFIWCYECQDYVG